ncbi:MAG: hypothetical protein KC777_02440 [Cyanobacteria bacterium HKST-UBA02]|nr:hypothetical protein [Cyanobacteria bacterium HKST-UBA02]
MLNIEAKIGDTIQVTFIKADSGVQTQERINNRRAFLDRKSSRSRPGDTCRVKIVGQNPGLTVYFVKVESVVKLGDGVSSPLEKVMEASRKRQNHEYGLETARALCRDPGELLDLLSNVLDYHRHGDSFWQLPDRAPISRAVLQLIDGMSDRQKAAERCLHLALTFDSSDPTNETFLQKGLDLIGKQSPEISGKIIAELIKTSRRYWDVELLERHLQNTEARTKETDRFLRRRLAEARLQAGNSAGVREALRPFEDHETIAEVMGGSYFQEKDYLKAREWLLKDTSDSFRVKKMIAECAVALGDLEEAVRFFREAMVLCERDLEFANEY